MKISVVIPTYNAADTIQRAIESCMQQTLPADEIILVDDASTDNTVQIAQEYDNITLLRQPKNAGPSAARNRGWDAATGTIVAFLDADDIWHKEKLATISKVFENDEQITYLGHGYTLDNNHKFSNNFATTSKSYLSILLRNPYQPSCLAVKKSLPLRFDTMYRYCEDHELSIRVAHKHKCHYADIALSQLGRPQLSTGGASGNIWKMRAGELRLYTSIYKHNFAYIVFIPLLWMFSIAKMIYRGLFK